MEEDETGGETLDEQSIEDLETELSNALSNEDYELASKLRDEINKRGA